MAEAKKRAAAELAAKNLAQLQKIDIAASKILDKMPFAAIYQIDPVKKTWDTKSVVEGTLFVYKRADRPYFSFLIANRNDPSDFIEPLTINHILRHDGSFIYFYKDLASIQALWFHKEEDALRIFNLLQKLVEKLKSSTTEQARAAAALSKQAPPTLAQAPPPAAQAPPTSSKAVDLLQMLKGAQNAPAPPTVNAPTAPEFNTMPVLLQKLMVQEQPRGMLKEPGTAMSADELEKDLLKTAKPKNHQHLMQDFTNSPSAISLAAISTKSVHGSEGDPDVADGELLEPLETSFVVGSGQETPILNKEQFISAITHLMRTDDDFVCQMHQAYVSALNSRLNLD